MEDKETEFNKIVRAHEETIYSVCLMYSDDGQEVDDLMQDTLINMWNGFEKFEGRSDIKTWIWRIAINTCIIAQRKNKKKVQVSALENMGLNSTEMVRENSRDQQISMLYDRIHQLGLFDRAIIMLWLDNQTYEQIGLMMGITPQNVGMRLMRIREKLMKMSNTVNK